MTQIERLAEQFPYFVEHVATSSCRRQMTVQVVYVSIPGDYGD